MREEIRDPKPRLAAPAYSSPWGEDVANATDEGRRYRGARTSRRPCPVSQRKRTLLPGEKMSRTRQMRGGDTAERGMRKQVFATPCPVSQRKRTLLPGEKMSRTRQMR